MKTSFQSSVFLSLSLVLLTSLASAQELQFSKTVAPEQSAALQADLALDWTLPADTQMSRTLGVPNLSNNALKKFITDRIHYVIGETEDVRQNLGIVQDHYVYVNPGVLPDFEKPVVLPPPPPPPPGQPQHEVLTVMSNIGTSFYFMGKQNNALLGYHFTSNAADIVVPVTSPYAGILRIGAGLFKINMKNANVSAKANSIFRVATLLHESHHSDGNAKSLGFPHAVCPEGHSYYNFNACDRNSNGPYSAGAEFVRQGRLKCLAEGSCTAGEAEVLAIVSTDSFSRVLDQKVLDATPEGL